MMLLQHLFRAWPGALDVTTSLFVMIDVVLAYILYRENVLSAAVTFALVASAALSLTLRWLVVKLDGTNVALSNALDKVGEEFAVVTAGLEVERQAHSATKGEHETTRLRLCDHAAETRAAKSQARRWRAEVRAARASNAALEAVLTARAGDIDAATARLAKAEGKHAATRGRLDSAEERNIAIAESLLVVTKRREEIEAELAVAIEQRSITEQKAAALTTSLDSRTKEVRSSEAELAAMTAALHDKDAELSAAKGRLVVSSTKWREGKDQLAAMTADLLGEKAKISSLAAELGTARVDLAAKDAVIERQSVKISEGVLLVVDQGNAALGLKQQLLGSRTKLDSALFELELSKRAGIAMKGTITELTRKVVNLQTSVASLDVPAHGPSGIYFSADGKKNAAASETLIDSSKAATPSTLSSSSSGPTSRSSSVNSCSPEGSGRESCSETGSSIQPFVVEASAAPATPWSPTHAETLPAVVHTGAHNRPGRQRKGQRGQHCDTPQLRSTKSTKAKRQTLSRYFC